MTKSTKRRLYSRKGSRSRNTKNRRRVRSKRSKYHKTHRGGGGGWSTPEVTDLSDLAWQSKYGVPDNNKEPTQYSLDLDLMSSTYKPPPSPPFQPKPHKKQYPISNKPLTPEELIIKERILKEMRDNRNKNY